MNLLWQYRIRARSNRINSTLRFFILILASICLFVSGCGQSQIHQGGEEVLMPAASSPADTLGIVVDEKMMVLDVEPNSGAEKGGIQVGDIIESINDIPLTDDLSQETKANNAIQAKMAIWESKEGKVVRVQLQREGKVIILEIIPAPPAPRLSEATVTPVAPNMDYY